MRLTSPRAAGSNAVRTTPAISAALARPRTVTPQVPSADSRPCITRPTSAAAASRSLGAAGNAFGSNVMLTRVSTSAAAAGAAWTSWFMICRAASGAAGSRAALTVSARVEPGSGAVSMVTVTHRTAGRKPRLASQPPQLATQVSASSRSASQVEAGITRSVGVISPERRSTTMPYRPP